MISIQHGNISDLPLELTIANRKGTGRSVICVAGLKMAYISVALFVSQSYDQTAKPLSRELWVIVTDLASPSEIEDSSDRTELPFPFLFENPVFFLNYLAKNSGNTRKGSSVYPQ